MALRASVARAKSLPFSSLLGLLSLSCEDAIVFQCHGCPPSAVILEPKRKSVSAFTFFPFHFS